MGRKVDLQNTNTHRHTQSRTHTTKIGQKIAGFFSFVCVGYAAPSLSFFKRRRTMTLCACAIVVVAADVGAAAPALVVVVS